MTKKYKYVFTKQRYYMPSLNYYNTQKAIYEKLTGNSQLMASVSGIFDRVPQETSFPFITIGDISSNNLPNLNKNGIEQKLNINIWSREAGKKQTSDIMELIYGLLNNGTITVTGQTLVLMEFVSNSVELGDDGWTYHGIMRLRVVLYQN